MGLHDRDYMKRGGDEERSRRYDEEARESRYGDLTDRRMAQFRRAFIVLLVVIMVLFVVALLMSKS